MANNLSSGDSPGFWPDVALIGRSLGNEEMNKPFMGYDSVFLAEIGNRRVMEMAIRIVSLLYL